MCGVRSRPIKIHLFKFNNSSSTGVSTVEIITTTTTTTYRHHLNFHENIRSKKTNSDKFNFKLDGYTCFQRNSFTTKALFLPPGFFTDAVRRHSVKGSRQRYQLCFFFSGECNRQKNSATLFSISHISPRLCESQTPATPVPSCVRDDSTSQSILN